MYIFMNTHICAYSHIYTNVHLNLLIYMHIRHAHKTHTHIYEYILLLWVLWHINLYRLYNAKSIFM